MKKPHKSLKGLFRVSDQAGYLRFFSTIILFFIIWSLLAIIYSVYIPLGKLKLILVPNFYSSNLAESLFRDILNTYFSVFTLSILFLIIIIFWLSFITISAFYSRWIIFPSIKDNKDYLSYCAFSIPGIKHYQFPNDVLINTESKMIFSFPEGPLKASIKPGYALFASNKGICKTWVNPSDHDDLAVTIEHQDKIIDCFNINPGTLDILFENHFKDLFQSPYIKIDMAYSFPFPDTHDTPEQSLFMNLFSLCDSRNIQSIIEKVIIAEVKTAFLQFSKDSIVQIEQPKENEMKRGKEKRNIKSPNHHKTDAFFVSFIKNPEQRAVKRNRKRLMYLNNRLYPNIDSRQEEYKISSTLIESLNEILTKNIQGTMAYLFGSEIIEVKIIAIGE